MLGIERIIVVPSSTRRVPGGQTRRPLESYVYYFARSRPVVRKPVKARIGTLPLEEPQKRDWLAILLNLLGVAPVGIPAPPSMNRIRLRHHPIRNRLLHATL